MKFDLDCVRDILIVLEDSIIPNDSGATPKDFTAGTIKQHPRLAKYPPNQIMYTLRIMKDGGLVYFRLDPQNFTLQFFSDPMGGITYAGHQYLASIRDDTIWKNTARKLKEVGGTATLALVTAISEGFAKAAMDKLTPIP